MKLTPLPDGRIAITYTVDEDQALERARKRLGLGDTRHVAERVYRQLRRENAPDLVEAIAMLPEPRR